ncbi:hypothetical protein [Pseudoalteromonas rhizosphaerae]|uniref:hypothetical protein n=1 Tax=Pseudoalteromonas rhizosphaerae TaxID=2518973 RepID=UPI0012310F0D|nr:hypothetical protein [Pseudoalteromonas rhizosphaerae]
MIINKPLRAINILVILAALSACGDNSPSVEEPAPVDFDVEMSNFTMDFDTSKTFALNHRIPVSFTIRNTSKDATEETQVPVTFSFVEKNPIDPSSPIVCNSNAINVQLLANGEPTVVENEFIWPISECQNLAEQGKQVELKVGFYRDGEEINGYVNTKLPVLSLREAGVDVEYQLKTESSIGLLALPHEDESPTPVLSVQSGFVFNGADPYYSKINDDEIPEDLDVVDPSSGLTIKQELTFGMSEEQLKQLNQLPSSANLTYKLIAQNNPGIQLDLMIGQENGQVNNSYEFSEIQPGTADQVNHDLYLKQTDLDALLEGDLANEAFFILRGCIETSFVQDGNENDLTNDCKDVDINLERESNNISAASQVAFKKNQKRRPGSSRISVESEMDIDNTLQRNGILSRATGEIVLKGNIGRRFDVKIAEALAEAIVTKKESSYFHQIKVFNKVVAGKNENSKEGKKHLKIKHNFEKDKTQQVASLGYGFGPVRLGFKVSVGGRIGLDVDDDMDLLDDLAQCQTLLVSQEQIATCGYIRRTVTPNFSFTGIVFGGLNLRFVKAGVKARLRLLEHKFPLTGTLGFGLTDNERVLVRGNVDLDHSLNTISGKIKLVGSIKVFRFRRSKSVTLASFSSRPVTQQLLRRSTSGTLELL